jgi:hypothetical protein
MNIFGCDIAVLAIYEHGQNIGIATVVGISISHEPIASFILHSIFEKLRSLFLGQELELIFGKVGVITSAVVYNSSLRNKFTCEDAFTVY